MHKYYNSASYDVVIQYLANYIHELLFRKAGMDEDAFNNSFYTRIECFKQVNPSLVEDCELILPPSVEHIKQLFEDWHDKSDSRKKMDLTDTLTGNNEREK